ncbi:MAG: arginine--tRNA ligase [Candidatus Firestonebacteria bacterium]|nr:arginine--tRNA ligase [Candidatus Firestonebacteria bacterium]
MLKKIRNDITLKMAISIERSQSLGLLPENINKQNITLETPPKEEFGEISCTLPMQLARIAKKSPREIAEILIKNFPIEDNEYIRKIEIQGAGYMNFYFEKKLIEENLKEIIKEREAYGRSTIGKGEKIQIEFVSANPTGPLHVGHGRGAAIGDALSNICKACEYEVTKEYYINDVGNQMNNLGASTQSHYYKLYDRIIPLPENAYRGSYIIDIAKSVKDKYGNKYFEEDPKKSLPFFIKYTADYILEGIKNDLEEFGVNFDLWFRESSLHADGTVEKMLKYLKEKEFIYQKDGALWLKATAFGDDKDRVVINKDGRTTYLASDIAYHYNKFQRGFNKIINIWGADHHGYVPRIKATVKALGYSEDIVLVILYQLVNLLRDGKQVAMSTRTGEFITLEEVVKEVGKDVSRFYFLMRTSDSHLDFDLELAKKQSMENPVYYIQYAYARSSSIFQEARKREISFDNFEKTDLSLLNMEEETILMKKLAYYPLILESSALTYEPHRIINYLQELARMFHSYYNKYRVINEDKNITQSRLTLIYGIRIVIGNALKLLGVSAPESM